MSAPKGRISALDFAKANARKELAAIVAKLASIDVPAFECKVGRAGSFPGWTVDRDDPTVTVDIYDPTNDMHHVIAIPLYLPASEMMEVACALHGIAVQFRRDRSNES